MQLEWQQAVAFDKDRFALRMPLVVGPRFNPKPIVQTVDFDANGQGWGQVTDPVPDRGRIEPPVLDPAENAPANPVTLTVRLDAGFAIGEIKSHHHEVDIAPWQEGGDRTEEGEEGRRVVTLKAGAAPADRDFELTWTPMSGTAPSVGLFRETVAGSAYVVAFVTPPEAANNDGQASDEADAALRPRETIFVIDNSGSMGGESIRQAKDSLLHGLGRLKPGDSFNVIRFDDTFDSLFSRASPATAENIARARAFVSALEAGGGTMMLAPMEAALADAGHPANRTALRQVVFLTDGAIGNEAQLMDLVGAKRGRARVFMVGIGSAPNSHLMSRIAEIGRGSFTHIGSVEQVASRMTALFEKLESPAVTDLAVALDGVGGDITPHILPDLYRGEPLVVAGRLDGAGGSLSITGRIGETPWQVTLPLAQARDATGISKLWARRKIRDAEIAARLGTETQESVDGTVLRLALDHGLVSRLTSLVAVERAISRPEGATLTRADVPLNLPKGWDFEKVFGPRGETVHQRAQADGAGEDGENDVRLEKTLAAGDGAVVGFPAGTHMTAAVQQRFASVAKSNGPVLGVMSLQTSAQPVMLPGTATDAELRIVAGLLLALLAVLSFVVIGRARRAGRSDVA